MKKAMTREELRGLTDAQLGKLLTDKEKKIAEEWVKDQNATQAAIRAGYAEKNAAAQASRTMKKPAVMEYRDRKMREACEAAGITPEFVRLGCVEVWNRCMEKTPVKEWDSSTKAWIESGKWQFDARGALKALDTMAILLGMRDAKKAEKSAEGVEEYLSRIGDGKREF